MLAGVLSVDGRLWVAPSGPAGLRRLDPHQGGDAFGILSGLAVRLIRISGPRPEEALRCAASLQICEFASDRAGASQGDRERRRVTEDPGVRVHRAGIRRRGTSRRT